VLTNLVRCCSAFAHTPTSPTSLDSRCSAIGSEPEAPDNGQAIDAGQAAAPIRRMHHSNERPVGGAKIGHAEEPVSAAGTALSPYAIYYHRTRDRVINYWHQGRPAVVLTVSLPTTPGDKTRKIGPVQPACHMVPRWYLRKSKLAFWRNVPNGH
jgi:hypothetical protein